MHAAKLRVELSQSRREQHEYLGNVELARVLDKRAERKRKGGDGEAEEPSVSKPKKQKAADSSETTNESYRKEKKARPQEALTRDDTRQLGHVLDSIF